MIKITAEIDGKKYELVPSEEYDKEDCYKCVFLKSLRETQCPLPDWNGYDLCYILNGIWKEVRDADND